MTQFDWERARAKNVKGYTPQVRRAPKRPPNDYDWENPKANKGVPYVWEHASLEHTLPGHAARVHERMQELIQPLDDGWNPLRIFFNVFGRLNRAAYVKRWVPLALIASIGLRLLGFGAGMSWMFYDSVVDSGMPFYIVLGALIIFYAGMKALQIRRLHDLGLSAIWLSVTIAVDAGLILATSGLWFLCLVLAMIYNFIFIYFYGSFGPNRYGPDPILRDLGDQDFFTNRSRFSHGMHSPLSEIFYFIVRMFF